jgi:hypothetical protein
MKTHRKGVIAAITTLLICAATAAAYFLIVYTFSGEGSSTAGKSTPVSEPLTVSMEPGITPGISKVLTINTSSASNLPILAGAKLVVTYTTSSPECKPEWFTTVVTGTEGKELERLLTTGTESGTTIKLGVQSVAVSFRPGTSTSVFDVMMKEEAAVNQSACESATITAHAKLTGTAT